MNGYVLRMPLPFVRSTDVQLARSAANELIVHIGNHKRLIDLPHTLALMEVTQAKQEDGVLIVTFERAGHGKDSVVLAQE